MWRSPKKIFPPDLFTFSQTRRFIESKCRRLGKFRLFSPTIGLSLRSRRSTDVYVSPPSPSPGKIFPRGSFDPLSGVERLDWTDVTIIVLTWRARLSDNLVRTTHLDGSATFGSTCFMPTGKFGVQRRRLGSMMINFSPGLCGWLGWTHWQWMNFIVGAT